MSKNQRRNKWYWVECLKCSKKAQRVTLEDPCSHCGGRLVKCRDTFDKRIDKQHERIQKELSGELS